MSDPIFQDWRVGKVVDLHPAGSDILSSNEEILNFKARKKANRIFRPDCCFLFLSQTTNFRLFQNERLCRRQFYIDEKERKFSKRVENTVRKGETIRDEQFLLFPQCFQKTCTTDT